MSPEKSSNIELNLTFSVTIKCTCPELISIFYVQCLRVEDIVRLQISELFIS